MSPDSIDNNQSLHGNQVEIFVRYFTSLGTEFLLAGLTDTYLYYTNKLSKQIILVYTHLGPFLLR